MSVLLDERKRKTLKISGKSVRQVENHPGITPGLLNKWNYAWR